MATATLTSKGQLTLPKVIREALGVEPGDRLHFALEPDGTVTVRADTVDLATLRGRLKPSRRGVTLEQMQAAILRRGQPE